MKIKEYTVICMPHPGIDEEVNEDIADGWQPLGGVSVCWEPNERQFFYAQAMVKYDDNEKLDLTFYGPKFSI